MHVHDLVWDEERFSTGIAAIDRHHREFLVLANRVLDMISQGFVNGALENAIDELIAFARMHFEFEEGLMRQYGHTELEDHVADHLKLIGQLNTLKKNIPTNGTQKVRAELFTAFLIDLVELHLIHADGTLPKALPPNAGAA